MIGFILGLVGFIYLISRVHTLEKKIDHLEKGSMARPQAFKQAPPTLGVSQSPVVARGATASEIAAASGAPAGHSAFIPAGALKYQQQNAGPAAVSRPGMTAPTSSMPAAKVSNAGTEFAVGSKLLTGVGVVAVFLGVTFFLRYAFENNLISESARIFLGVIFGLVLGGIGHALRKKYSTYGLTLVGAGLGVIYVSIYAAYAFYGLITVPTAYVILFFVMLLGVALSLLYNSLPLISYSLVGAFLIPLILPISLSVHMVFGYLLILNLAIVLIAKYRTWPGLPVGSLIATSLVALRFVVLPNADTLFVPVSIYLTLIFLIYLVTMVIHFSREDRRSADIDSFLLYAVPTLYFGLNAMLLHEQDSIAFLLLFIGIFYAVAAVFVRISFVGRGAIAKLSDTMISIAVIAIAGATVLHFQDRNVTILWALEAVVILLIGTMLHSRNNRIIGIMLAAFALVRGVFFDMNLPAGSMAIFNDRTVIYIVLLVPFVVMWFTYKYFVETGEMDKGEQEVGAQIGAIASWLLVFSWLTSEILQFVTVDAHLYLPLAWSIFIIAAVSISYLAKEAVLRYISYALMIATTLYLLISQWQLPSEMYTPIANIRVLSTIILLAALAVIIFLLKSHKDSVSKEEHEVAAFFGASMYIMILWILSVEVVDYFNTLIARTDSSAYISTLENTKRVVLSAAWLVYAIVTLAIGIVYRSTFARYFSIALFSVTIVKIFLYDTANLSDIYRFVSFILLGVILLLAGFAYYRFKNRIMHFVRAENTPNQ